MRRFLAAGLVCTALAACSSGSATGGIGVRSVAQPLPELRGSGLDGKELTSDSYRGHVLVLNIWASWCGPCQREQPDLVKLAHRYAGRGVEFLGVNHEDQEAAARAWVAHYHVPYPSISDPAGRFAAKLGYVGLPDTYVVDPNGTIRFIVGPGATNTAMLSGLIDQVLARSSS